MATTQNAQTHVAPVQIAVQNRTGSFISKLAELSEEQGQNEVTVACVESLGYSMRVGGRERTDIKLTWGPASGHWTDEHTFMIVNTLTRDFKLNDNTATSLLEKRRGPSSFPCFPKKGKDADKAERVKKDNEEQQRQKDETDKEKQRASQNLLRKSGHGANGTR